MGLVGIGITLMLVAVEGGWVYANAQFDKIERVDVDVAGDSVLAGSQGRHQLPAGRHRQPGGVDGQPVRHDPRAADRRRPGAGSCRSPATCWCPCPDRAATEARINAAYNDGPVTLIRTVQESRRHPHRPLHRDQLRQLRRPGRRPRRGHHQLPHPGHRPSSGLNIQQSGDVELNGEQALAYVRSRIYQEVIDGEVQPADGIADLEPHRSASRPSSAPCSPRPDRAATRCTWPASATPSSTG